MQPGYDRPVYSKPDKFQNIETFSGNFINGKEKNVLEGID